METKNKIQEIIRTARKGHYCHALEVGSVYELEAVIESIGNEFLSEEITQVDLLCFFETISIYYIEDAELTEQENKKNEEEVYNFNFATFIEDIF